MKKMVVGFAFSEDLARVLLVKKLRPEWQKNFWNGVGGKIEPGERGLKAMVREFREETSLETSENDWECTVVMRVLENKAMIFFFRAIVPETILFPISGEKNDVGEKLGLFLTARPFTDEWLPNLRWLIPLQNQPLEFPIWVVEKKKGGF